MMLFEVGDEVRVRQPTNIFHSELGKVVSIDHVKLTYKVVFHRGNSDVYTCFDLILVKRQEETSMRFKVGDKVTVVDNQFGNKGKVGEITNIMGMSIPYHVSFGIDGGQWYESEELELVTEEELELVTEEETSMKFKVGDKVKVKDSWFGHDGQVGVVLDTDNYEPYSYNIKFDTEGDNGRRDENFMGDSLELVTEAEETSMRFKVGDKVKVSNSWEGRDGATGQIVDINVYNEFTHEVRFEDMGAECFREEELELFKEKQSFTKSDLKTGMGVVLRDGAKGHVLIGTGLDDIIKDIEKSQWIKIEDYSEELTCRGYQNLDIVEVYTTEYENKFLSDRMFDGKAVYVREEPKPEPTKMTMKEINEHFGKAIEIVE